MAAASPAATWGRVRVRVRVRFGAHRGHLARVRGGLG